MKLKSGGHVTSVVARMLVPELSRNDPCPCGSGTKYKLCCLEGMKRVSVSPPSPATGYSHEGCYASALRDCSSTMSREHAIPERILRAMAAVDSRGEGALIVSNVAWQGAREDQSRLRPRSLAARVLCTRHNNTLSPLDDVGARFFELMRDIIAERPARSLAFASGSDFERFLVKVAAGWVAAGLGMTDNRRRIDRSVPEEWLPVLWGDRFLEEPDGLYFDARRDVRRDAKLHFSVGIATDRRTGRPVGMEAVIQGLRFVLVVGSSGRRPMLPPEMRFRPKLLSFRRGDSRHVVSFAWADGRQRSGIEIALEASSG